MGDSVVYPKRYLREYLHDIHLNLPWDMPLGIPWDIACEIQLDIPYDFDWDIPRGIVYMMVYVTFAAEVPKQCGLNVVAQRRKCKHVLL